MNLTFLKKIKQIISQNKYAFFVLALIVLVVIGVFFSGYLARFFIGGKKAEISKTPSTSKELPEQQNMVNKTKVVVEEFNKKVPTLSVVGYGSDVIVKKEVLSSDLTEINNNSNVYSVVQYKPDELLKIPSFINLDFKNSTIVKGQINGNLDDFESAYLRLLNNSSSMGNYSFTIKKISEKNVDLVGQEYLSPEDFSSLSTFYTQTTYALYLNGYLFSDSFGQSAVSVIYNKYEKTVDFNILKFFPKTVTLVGNTSFDSGEYQLTPKLNLDPDLVTVLINRGVFLKTPDFIFNSDSKPTLTYIYDPSLSLVVPQISYPGSIRDIQGVLNNEVVFMPK